MFIELESGYMINIDHIISIRSDCEFGEDRPDDVVIYTIKTTDGCYFGTKQDLRHIFKVKSLLICVK